MRKTDLKNVRALVCDQVWDRVLDQVEDQVWDRVWARMHDQVLDLVYNRVRAQLKRLYEED